MVDIIDNPYFWDSATSYHLPASGWKIATRFKPWKNVTSDKLGYAYRIAGANQTVQVGIQADSSGVPSGSYLGSTTSSSFVSGYGWNETTLSSPLSLTQGVDYWIVTSHISGTADASNSHGWAGMVRTSGTAYSQYPYNGAEGDFVTYYYNGTTWLVIDTKFLGAFYFGDIGMPYFSHVNFNFTIPLGTFSQVFTPTKAYLIDNLTLHLSKNGTISTDIKYRFSQSGAVISQGTFANSSSLTTTYSEISAAVSPFFVTSGDEVTLDMYCTTGDPSNYVTMHGLGFIVSPTGVSTNELTFGGTVNKYSSNPAYDILYDLDSTEVVEAGGDLLFANSMATKTKHTSTISGSLLFNDLITVSKRVAPVAGKETVYKVYTSDDVFVGVWRDDVVSSPGYTQRLNTAGATMAVRLARSANRTIEQRDTLSDQTGDVLTTEDGESLIASYVTNNTVGEDTDVQLNYNVDVYEFYGSYENLTTESGENLITEDGDELLIPLGAPSGQRIFSGFILDYTPSYGTDEYVDVTLLSHGSWELSNNLIKSGSTTTVSYSSTDRGTIMRNIVGMNVGKMSYSTSTISLPGDSGTHIFRLNTIQEGIASVYDSSADGWYWYGNVADNQVYYQNKSASPDHTFILGQHIKNFQPKRTMENLKNNSYIVGAETAGVPLYKNYTDATSISDWRQGLDRRTDRRVSVAATAQSYADKKFSRYSEPIYSASISIPSEVYDIETVRLGQIVGFSNFGNYVDDLVLQITELTYSPYLVTLTLGENLEKAQDLPVDIQDDLQDEQFQTVPSVPS